MDDYVCGVCGYIYSVSKGSPETGVAPGTPWQALPESWVCPVCGADRSAFAPQETQSAGSAAEPAPVAAAGETVLDGSELEWSALCTNLARGCEKQYKPKEESLFRKLADYFRSAAASAQEPDMAQLKERIAGDLRDGLPGARAAAEAAGDRGALRALVWNEKVTRILQSILARYQKEGEALVEDTGVYVCTICGFVYIGDNLPQVCPVCKVPNWKFEKIEGRL